MIGEVPGSDQKQTLTELPGGLTQTIQIAAEHGGAPVLADYTQEVERASAGDPAVAAAIQLLKFVNHWGPRGDYVDWTSNHKQQLSEMVREKWDSIRNNLSALIARVEHVSRSLDTLDPAAKARALTYINEERRRIAEMEQATRAVEPLLDTHKAPPKQELEQ